uniref:Uromodulin n=1 Tax=Dicentrarchus labrax TaxID=13489 RepID=A0A8C4F6B3_DICLA
MVSSCVCKDGFVGDGLTCYNTKLCGDSSCCSQGYHWSPERGCVDTDECSLPDSPCIPPQVCQNTQGSFQCLEPSSSPRSGPSSQSVQFNCGQSVCPVGLDCISNNGSLRCADPCEHYTALNDDWRSTNNTSNQILHCDRNINWQGWYRLFLEQTSAQIPERCIDSNRCGTHAPLWITEPHPTQSGQIVNRTVCNNWSGSCCYFSSHIIHVKLCYGNFYVYKLVQPSTCHLAYCAADSPVRLVNSDNRCSGRVEIFHRGQWGTVCDDAWDLKDANVVCRQLDCGPARSALQAAAFGQGSGPIWLDDVSCFGNESSITDCRHRGFGVHNCGHGEDASITNSTHAIYSNSLFIYPINNASFAIPVSLPFSCAYPLDTDTSLNVAIRPFLATAGGISGTGTKARASMFLFRNSNYTETYAAGRVTLPVGSPLYVGVSVEERDPGFVVVLEDCYATHSSNPDDPMRHFLIQNKQVSVTESGSSLQARFSALFFLLQDEYRDIFLHCSLSLCDRKSSSCVPVSHPFHFINRIPLSIGPIVCEYGLQAGLRADVSTQ